MKGVVDVFSDGRYLILPPIHEDYNPYNELAVDTVHRAEVVLRKIGSSGGRTSYRIVKNRHGSQLWTKLASIETSVKLEALPNGGILSVTLSDDHFLLLNFIS